MNALGQDCRKLEDGTYLFKHKTKGHSSADFLLTVKGDEYTMLRKSSQESSTGQITWWPSNCLFKLSSQQIEVPKNLDSLNSAQQILIKTELSYGGTCYELVSERKFRMTYCGNLHITKSEGKIVRK